MNKRIFFLVLWLLFLFPYLSAQTSLLMNSGFEEGTGDFPNYWKQDSWLKDTSVTEYAWVTGTGHSGNRCMLIRNYEPNDARIVQQVTILQEKLYKFSCWIKTENIGNEGAGAVISIVGLQDISTGLHGTTDWQEVEIYIKGASADLAIQLSAGIGGYGAISSGSAWFDDAVLAEIDDVPAYAKLVTLKNKGEGLTQSEKDKYKLKIETRPSYWIITILIIIAAAVILVVIIKRIKRDDKTESNNLKNKEQENNEQAENDEPENNEQAENNPDDSTDEIGKDKKENTD